MKNSTSVEIFMKKEHKKIETDENERQEQYWVKKNKEWGNVGKNDGKNDRKKWINNL